MTIRDLCEPEICGLQAILPDIIKIAAPLPANVLKKLLTIINDEQESRRERAKFGDWVKSSAEQIKKEQPTDEIKVGDRVKFKSKEELETMLEPSFWWGIPLLADKEAEIINIPFENDYRVDIDPSLGGIRREFFDKLPKKQPHDNTITIPDKADLDDTYWDAYKAELASKIAVVYAEKGRFAPDEIGGFAVRVANYVVNNLKKQEQC